jgi:hypothetical protein
MRNILDKPKLISGKFQSMTRWFTLEVVLYVSNDSCEEIGHCVPVRV